MKSKKGPAFERWYCRQLSLWWTKDDPSGPKDDVFWRTSASGARATQRAGKRTFGQYGDIQAVDPIGAPLMRLLCMELKRGYSKHSFADALDCTILTARQQWEQFMEQTITSQQASHAKHWFLVQRRDKRQTFVFFPYAFFSELGVAIKAWPRPFLVMRVRLRSEDKDKSYDLSVCATTWKNFAQVVKPSQLK